MAVLLVIIRMAWVLGQYFNISLAATSCINMVVRSLLRFRGFS